MYQLKNIFFSCMFKMSKISKKCKIETINKGQYFCISRRDLQIKSGYSNWTAISDKFDPNKQKCRYELMPNTKFWQCGRFVRIISSKEKLEVLD